MQFKKVEFKEGTAGIGRYKNHQLNWAIDFLRGNVRVYEAHEKFQDPESFHLYVEPNLETLESIDTNPDVKDPSTMRPFYDAANRAHGIFLGPFASLDDIESNVHLIEPYFIEVLQKKGAENRILRPSDQFNNFSLVPTNGKTEESFTNALLAARDLEVYVALKQGKNIPFEQMVGRVFRNLANALGVNYHIQQEPSEDSAALKAITFTYEGIGGFRFEDNGLDQPVGLTRYSYGSHQKFGNSAGYFVTFEGEATADNMQEKVFNWLIDAMKDISPERLESDYLFEQFLENRAAATERFYGNFLKSSDNIRQTKSGAILKLV